jgi:pyruvate dehydrogenase E2 component (dihydrolipoamide acetyltransferase)
MIRFELPSLGADMDEGTLLEWRVKPGDAVARGQVVAVVDTSKAAVDVEIWQAGTVAELQVQPGDKFAVGTVMMTLTEPGEAPAAAGPPPAATAQPAVAAVRPPAPPPAAPPPAAPPSTAPAPASPPPPAPPPGAPWHPPTAVEWAAQARHPVSPSARRRARELGVDVERVPGSGPHGSVTLADVERAAAAGLAAATAPGAGAARAPSAVNAATGAVAPPGPAGPPAPAAPPAGTPSAVAAAAAQRQAAMRAAIAAAMSRSKREIPHYYLAEAVPMAAALDWLQRRNAGVPITERILPAVLMIKAVARALRRTPELNGFFRDGRFEPAGAVHAGVAIALRGGGLVAPAIHDVNDKDLPRLMRDLSDLVRRARAGSLRSSEMSDPTITVTNLGDQGVDSVFGVIYPPQVAIVGFGRIAERPWAQHGWLRAMPVVGATLAADHRVSDGHRGALFLAELRDLLQQPEALAEPDGDPPDDDRPTGPG